MTNVERIVARLRDISQSFPAWQTPKFRKGADHSAVLQLERDAGVSLSSEFREFLLLGDAVVAIDVHNGYFLGGTRELTRSHRRGDFPRQVDVEAVATRAVPVATDGGGNGFLQCVTTERVLCWRQAGTSATVVAPSFALFLERIAEDWEHAAQEDSEWQYLV